MVSVLKLLLIQTIPWYYKKSLNGKSELSCVRHFWAVYHWRIYGVMYAPPPHHFFSTYSIFGNWQINLSSKSYVRTSLKSLTSGYVVDPWVKLYHILRNVSDMINEEPVNGERANELLRIIQDSYNDANYRCRRQPASVRTFGNRQDFIDEYE